MSQRIVIPQQSWLHGVGHAPKAASALSKHDVLKMVGYKIKTSDTTGTPVTTITLKDKDGDVLYTFADTPAKNTVTVRMGLEIPLTEGEIVTIDPSADAGGADTFTVDVVLYAVRG